MEEALDVLHKRELKQVRVRVRKVTQNSCGNLQTYTIL